MILRIDGTEIEGIHSSVGEASTLTNFLMTSDFHKRTYRQISGWVPDTSKGDRTVDKVDYYAGYLWRMKIYNTKILIHISSKIFIWILY